MSASRKCDEVPSASPRSTRAVAGSSCGGFRTLPTLSRQPPVSKLSCRPYARKERSRGVGRDASTANFACERTRLYSEVCMDGPVDAADLQLRFDVLTKTKHTPRPRAT